MVLNRAWSEPPPKRIHATFLPIIFFQFVFRSFNHVTNACGDNDVIRPRLPISMSP